MKLEQIIKDGKAVGVKRVFEAGDKTFEQIGDFICLDKEATANDYEYLTNKVLQQMLEFIKDSGKVWDYESSEFITKTKEDFSYELPDGKNRTLGFKIAISRIVEEGENL